jgi:hypothetical protein
MWTPRKHDSNELYEKWKREHKDDPCVLCLREPLRDFKYWKIVQNHFPYDKYTKTHHLLALKRHVDETGLDQGEQVELVAIKQSLGYDIYDGFYEPVMKERTLPDHVHSHLIEWSIDEQDEENI